MALFWMQGALAVLSGGGVGFSLGLIGGGGSILCTSRCGQRVRQSHRPLARRQHQMAVIFAVAIYMLGRTRLSL
jgi:hypothetical protein